VTVHGGKVLTSVNNTGTLHITLDGLEVRGLSAAGAQTFATQAQGWYVLPGATRTFEVPIETSACCSTSSIAVEVMGHGSSLKSNGSVSAGVCGAP
jgi:P pilus assembly chaperone PapD